MKNQANPWLTSNLWVLSLGLLPAAVLICILLYFTAWAFAFSFTDLALVGKKSVEWSWVGLQNFERLFTRRGFLDGAHQPCQGSRLAQLKQPQEQENQGCTRKHQAQQPQDQHCLP